MDLLGDTRAVSPLIGYILTFAITSMLVLTVIWTSSDVLDRRHKAAARLQLEDLAHRVANAVEEAFHVVDANPDADYRKRLPLPREVRGFAYVVEVNETDVFVNASNPDVVGHTVLHNPKEHPVDGTLQRRESALVLYDPGTGAITIEGGS